MALIESKKNVFSTLYNMFDLEFKNGAASGQTAVEMTREKQKEILDLTFLGKMIKKMAILEGQLKEFLEKIKDALKASPGGRELEDEGKILAAELREILAELRQGNEARESGKIEKAALEMEMKLEEEKKRNEAKARRMEQLKQMCRINLERSEKIRDILDMLTGVSEIIKFLGLG